jgi:hypothetical protein
MSGASDAPVAEIEWTGHGGDGSSKSFLFSRVLLKLVQCLKNLFSLLANLHSGQSLPGGGDLSQDVFALGPPDVAPSIGVSLGQEADDGLGEFTQRGKTLLCTTNLSNLHY